MKTLLERLKPEIVSAMELDALKYPASVEMFKRHFEGKNYYTQLDVSCVLELFKYTKSKNYSLLELVGMFEEI